MNLNLTQAQLRSVLRYDEATGEFSWIAGQRAGLHAGCVVSTGYVKINIETITYLAHRLAWLYVTGEWPKHHIDHLNGKPADNRFCNLRDVDQATNVQNRRRAQTNASTGVLGASPHHTGKFRARIRIDGKERHIGVYPTVSEAHAAYLKAKRQHHAGCTL